MNPSTSAAPSAATPPGSTTTGSGGPQQAQPPIVAKMEQEFAALTATIAKLDPAARGPVVAARDKLQAMTQNLAQFHQLTSNTRTELETERQVFREAQEAQRVEITNGRKEAKDEIQRESTELSARAAKLDRRSKWLAVGGAGVLVLAAASFFRNKQAPNAAQGYGNEGRAQLQQVTELPKLLQYKLDIGQAVGRAAVAIRIMMYSDPNSKNYDTAYGALLDSVKTFKAYAQNSEISPEVRAVVGRMYNGAFSIAKQGSSSTGLTNEAAEQNARTASEEIMTAWRELMK